MFFHNFLIYKSNISKISKNENYFKKISILSFQKNIPNRHPERSETKSKDLFIEKYLLKIRRI
ncbi:TPA: hypothetical protein DEG21_05790 [Patescibacteria group bacterium]|nr:hypothetical protein [Candidatus Gracilibacteria bacterium]HBY75326.1 hypothetical protein [Candidatus Gracilibacteria bacterium]